MKRQGCSLKQLGAHEAATNSFFRSSASIDLSENARGLQRLRIRGSTPLSAAPILIFSTEPDDIRSILRCADRVTSSPQSWLVLGCGKDHSNNWDEYSGTLPDRSARKPGGS